MKVRTKLMRARALIALTLVMALAMSMLATSPSAAKGKKEKPQFTLTILHNNDGESKLLASDIGGLIEEDGPSRFEGGVARFETVVEREKRDATRGGKGKKSKRGVVMLSSGDNFLAGPEFTASLDNGVFYDAIALDAIGYDAIALGNHDFDFGPDVLARFIGEGFSDPGTPPYLSANLDFTAEAALQALVESDVIAASTIVRERGERIGIIGATTENLSFISSPRDVVVNAVLPAVQLEIEELQDQGVEIIILISHLQDIDGDIALAQDLPGVDVMIAGGGDELLANPGDPLLPSDDCLPDTDNDPDTCNPDGVADALFGEYPLTATNADGATVPVVTTSGNYGYLGKLVVEFDKHGEVLGFDGGPIRIVDETFADGVAPDATLQAQVVEPVADFVAGLDANVLATSEVALDGTRASVRSEEANVGNLLADAQLWQATQLAADFGEDPPDVALQNGGGIRNDSVIPAGDFTELDTFQIAAFGNFTSIVPDIPREQFKEILENAVSRTQPGDTPGGSGRFPQIAGFSMTWSGSGTAQVLDADGNVTTTGTRIQEVVLDDGTVIVTGGVVQPGPDISIAIADFLARGGDEYPFRGAPFTVLGATYQQALADYVSAPTAEGGLGGLITAADYPFGGEGRNVELP